VVDKLFEISIIVPCRNEAENVLELTERAHAMFEAHGLSGEVIFVNDGSSDHTGKLIDELAARHDYVRAIHHPQNRGIPAGWQSGSEAAAGRYIAIMDGDLQYLPEDVYRLYRQLKHSNADIVQGWRSHIGRPRDFRYAMSRVLHHLLRILFGVRLFDVKSGFLICDREIFANILRHRFAYYYFQSLIVASAHHKGYRIDEIETLFEERKLGESFISSFPFTMILKNLADLVNGFVEFRLLPARTDILADSLSGSRVNRFPDPLPLTRRLSLNFFGLLMPLHHWKLSSTSLRYYYQLRRTQWLPRDEIRQLQEARLRALVKHAYRHVPYYREMFDRQGIKPEGIRNIADLQHLPVLSKSDVRTNLHFDLLSDTHDKRQMLPVTTSGNSGEPLTYYADKTQLEMGWAINLRNQEWVGYHFGDRRSRIRQSTFRLTRLEAIRFWLDTFLSRCTVLPGADLDRESIRRLAESLKQYRPTLLEGDAETLELIAHYAGENGGGVTDAVISSGQTLSDERRADMERAFGAPVFDKYASRRFGTVAHECEQRQGCHVNAESFIVEILRDGRPARNGESGEIVITDLTNLSAPLIRHATGDRATATDEECPCGRGLPLIRDIEGRSPALIVGANGCFVPGAFFADMLKDYEHIVRQFQVVQEQHGLVDLRIVKGPRFSERSLDQILTVFGRQLGDTTPIHIEFFDGPIQAQSDGPSQSVFSPSLNSQPPSTQERSRQSPAVP
jgi:phenylacetate-CoA ligase